MLGGVAISTGTVVLDVVQSTLGVGIRNVGDKPFNELLVIVILNCVGVILEKWNFTSANVNWKVVTSLATDTTGGWPDIYETKEIWN